MRVHVNHTCLFACTLKVSPCTGARGRCCVAVSDCCVLGRIHSDCSSDLLSPSNPLNMGVVSMFFTRFPYVAALSASLWGPLMGVPSKATFIPLYSLALLTSTGAWMVDARRPLPDSVHDGADRREHQALNHVDRTILMAQAVDYELNAPGHFDYTIIPGQTGQEGGLTLQGEQLGGDAAQADDWVMNVRLLEDWFVEGRATQLALGMLLAGIQARGRADYVEWAGTSLQWLSQWAPGFDGLASPELTPVVFHRWARDVELQLWERYLEGEHSNSSSSGGNSEARGPSSLGFEEADAEATCFMESGERGTADASSSTSSRTGIRGVPSVATGDWRAGMSDIQYQSWAFEPGRPTFGSGWVDTGRRPVRCSEITLGYVGPGHEGA